MISANLRFFRVITIHSQSVNPFLTLMLISHDILPPLFVSPHI
ncbi:unnamed protein product [Brassica oleracea]